MAKSTGILVKNWAERTAQIRKIFYFLNSDIL